MVCYLWGRGSKADLLASQRANRSLWLMHMQVKVDGLERSNQHRNMHKLSSYSTCNRSRRVTDTVPQTRSQISEVRHARADPFRANRHAAQCTLLPQCHSWATLPPRHTATCETDMHRQPEHGSRHNCARPQPHTCTTLQHLQEGPCCPIMLPSAPPASPADTRAARAATAAEFRMLWVGIMSSWRIKPPSRRSSQIDASVTTASGVDLWTAESVSVRSRTYARLRWGLRVSIARSPRSFAPRPYAPSRSHVHLIGIRM